jgi:hypothetical protein
MGRTVLDYLWKAPLCVLTYLVGLAVGGVLATALGLSLPAIPTAGSETSQLLGLLVGCTLLVLSLGPLPARPPGGSHHAGLGAGRGVVCGLGDVNQPTRLPAGPVLSLPLACGVG